MTAVSLRFYAELADLAGTRHHLVPVTAPRSVKDLTEALGVPHVEVALVLCDGAPVPLTHLVRGGERVAVLPPLQHLGSDGAPRSSAPVPDPPRFLCDVHLGTLARRLRLLGLDTRYEREWDDAKLASVAAQEGRILLSRDRGLLKRRVVTHGYLPRSDDPEEQAIEVVHRFGLGPHLAPATRCVPCNGGLEPVDLASVADRVPPRTAAAIDSYARCRDCGRVFWPGSHHEALQPFIRRIERVARGRPPPAAPPDRQ